MAIIDTLAAADLDLPPKPDPLIWDGIHRGYIPPAHLAIDASLILHQETAEDIDPVTYEVVRYSLMNINIEHGLQLQRLCVSQNTRTARDYQTSLLTHDGDILMLGPNVQYFSNSASLAVKFMLERRSKDPGIHPGDMLISNDVYVGAPHQPDTNLAAPVFVGDELFCWVTNTLHHEDLGGTWPGSFCFGARDAWDEPLNWPPVTLVEGGKLRVDIEQLFIRQSRFPTIVQMDLRAAIAANEYTREKVAALVDRYGAPAVKGVMLRMLDAGERLFRERLEPLPDGVWSHRAYTEAAVPGDRELYTYQINVTKAGDRLIVDNRGTDAQTGAINVSFSAFSGAALAAIMGQLVPDLAGAYGGAYRCVEFRPVQGLMSCADHPAAVSPSGATTTITIITSAATAVSKMLASGNDDTRARIVGPTMAHGYSFGAAGTDTCDEPWLLICGDVMLGSSAGRPGADGVDIGGHWWIPSGTGPNVEDMEGRLPVLILYRRMLSTGLDGSGQQRGGVGFAQGGVFRGAKTAATTMMLNEGFPKGQGVFGGGLGSRASVTFVKDSDIYDRLARGEVPSSMHGLTGEWVEPGFKVSLEITDRDAWEWTFPNMVGYGDRLRRDPEAVLADLRGGFISPEAVERVYGVVLNGDGVDPKATAIRRHEMRSARLGDEAAREGVDPPDGAWRVGEVLHVVDGRWWCNGADLGPVGDNYKDQARMIETPVRMTGPEYENSDHAMADRIVLREFVCPVTGYLIDTELAMVDDELLHDIKLRIG
jgi:N-methylhydantoinase B